LEPPANPGRFRAVGTGQNGNIQEFTGERENGLAGGAGQQTVVADAVVVDGAT
jgi:hypothetical protein